MARERPEKGLSREVRGDLDKVPVRRGVPLVAVDCDEVIVHFAIHLSEWLKLMGYEMRLESYRLEGAIFPARETTPVPFDAALQLIDAFFEEETHRQLAIDGAVEALGRLAEVAQLVVLTNIPRHARADRVKNIASLGLDLPLVANTGGKGRALAVLAERARAPAVFIDDSHTQIASARRHAPDVGRVYFRGSPFIADIMPDCPEADAEAHDWAACEAEVRRMIGA